MFSCVASADDETAEPALFFDAETEDALRPAKVELLWCRDGDQSLGFLDCQPEVVATESAPGGIVRKPLAEPGVPPEITFEELPDGVRYRLPKRPYPDVRPPRQGVFNVLIVLNGLGLVSMVVGGIITTVDEMLPRSVERTPLVWSVALLIGCVMGFPGLIPLAEHLAQRVTLVRRRTGSPSRRTRVGNQVDLEVFDNVNPAEFHRDVRVQPKDSQASIDRMPDGLKLTVPPSRNIVRRDRNSRTVCRGEQILSIILVIALAGLFWSGPPHHPAAIGGSILLTTIALSVWCFAVGASLDMSLRQTGCFKATVVVDRLTVDDTTRFPGTRRTWHLDDIAVIVTGLTRLDSLDGGKSDGHELQIHLHNGDIVSLLDGHEFEELLWVATLLRESLGVRAIDPPEY